MTADKDQTPRSPTSGSFSSSYASAFVYPGVGSPKAVQQSPKKHPHGPRTRSGESSSSVPIPQTSPISPSDLDPRDKAGSSRTKFSTVLPKLATSPTKAETDSGLTFLNDTFSSPKDAALHQPPEAPYRSPEPVYEPPEEHPPGYVPGVIEEHPGSDDGIDSKTSPLNSSPPQDVRFDVSNWQREVRPNVPTDVNVDDQDPERPQLGPGSMPRRVNEQIHEHNLYRLTDIKLPSKKTHGSQPSAAGLMSPKPTPADGTLPKPDSAGPTSPTSVQPQSTGSIDEKHIRTLAEVKDALPGGADGIDQWYFCWQCCVWYRVSMSRIGLVDGTLRGATLDWDSVHAIKQAGAPASSYSNDSAVDPHRGKAFLRDVEQSRKTPSSLESHIHFHELRSSRVEPSSDRLERVDVREEFNRFNHLLPGMESDIRPNWYQHAASDPHARLFLCCGTQASILVDAGPVAGQIPAGLMRSFTHERQHNPIAGEDPKKGVKEAIELLITLLANPLFKGQRGWIRLDNKKVMSRLGQSVATSVMLYMIGFGCKQEDDVLRVGPLSQWGEDITEEQMLQQDRYMMRTWVELNLFLHGWLKHSKLDPVPASDAFVATASLASDIDTYTDSAYLPIEYSHKEVVKNACVTLGVTRSDNVDTILAAYAQQKACDVQNVPTYLDALEQLSQHVAKRSDELSFALSIERSMGRYTLGELKASYDRIGYTTEYASAICVDPDEAPDEEILKMHREALQGAHDPAQRTALGQALQIVGRHRKNSAMQRLGSSGQSIMSVDEAYAALSAPRESVDDGLIMQYELAVDEYPGKRDHYRSCLEIISKDAGDERPDLKRFLETGSAEAPVIKRNDIPVGLQNIGNTCYLNSILQYLYSIKPLRDAVLSFEHDEVQQTTLPKPEVERAKRFVRQLRLLFLQLYKSESTSVRPDEELAYLAITKLEDDQQVAHPEPGSILDSLPTVGSPSSTRVNTPSHTRPSSPLTIPTSPSRSSVLGKRASQDRESNGSPPDRPKRSDRGLDDDLMSISDNEDTNGEDFEMVSKPGSSPEGKAPPPHKSTSNETVTTTTAQDIPQESRLPSSTPGEELEGLNLKSPTTEAQDPMQTNAVEPPHYAPPPGPPPPLPPRPRRNSKATLNAGLQFGRQQDSAEVLINVLSQLETAFEPPVKEDGSKGDNLIAGLFSCQYRQQLVYESSTGSFDAQTPVNSIFVHPIIGVEEEGKDLYDCLAELYLGGAGIEYEGKKGHMMDLMDRFPPMLYIQMRRSQFDRATGRESKTNTHIPFGQTLTMDRFLATADPQKRQQSIDLTRQMTQHRSRLHALRNQKPLSVTSTFDHLRKSLAALQTLDPDLDITDDFLPALDAEKEQVQKDIEEIEAAIPALRTKLENLWRDEHACEYELVSVFMHRGKTSGAGHYWTYQSNLPDHSDRFFKYNDETVTDVPASEVLQDRTGSDANPALLCYVRKGQGLVHTLHREVFEREQQEANTLNAAAAAPVAQADVDMKEDNTPTESSSPIDIDMSESTSATKPLIDLDGGDEPENAKKETSKVEDLMD